MTTGTVFLHYNAKKIHFMIGFMIYFLIKSFLCMIFREVKHALYMKKVISHRKFRRIIYFWLNYRGMDNSAIWKYRECGGIG